MNLPRAPPSLSLGMKPCVRLTNPRRRRSSIEEALKLRAAGDPSSLGVHSDTDLDTVPMRTAGLFNINKLTCIGKATPLMEAGWESLSRSHRYNVYNL